MDVIHTAAWIYTGGLMIYNANVAADAFLWRSAEKGMSVSNLMLQKLLYYAHAWNLVLNAGPLFREPIEAWVHGPVVPSVFRRFKMHRWNPIPPPATPCDDAALLRHLDSILTVYGRYTAKQLETLTHREAPWRDARRGYATDQPSNVVISDEAMQTFYSRLAANS